jgi:hypothetical protein
MRAVFWQGVASTWAIDAACSAAARLELVVLSAPETERSVRERSSWLFARLPLVRQCVFRPARPAAREQRLACEPRLCALLAALATGPA